ncbi:MAG: tannase/feruloyl esterase family alpha/beta hydrolase [Acidobacteria bacterium]|nr:tannase/feruloyl esterase family alpha/beta hydrolase [Acidobacteriota bacterium]
MLVTPPAFGATCESLASLKLPDTTITAAEAVAAGALSPPPPPARAGGAGRGGGGRGQPAGSPFADLPAFCRVAADVRTSPDTSIRIEVWMPANGWNEKFLATGYAFFGGTMSPAILAGPLRNGYATATTDNGLPPGTPPQDGGFLRGHHERIIDWGERAWHETVFRAKAIITAYYGRPPAYSYFNGAGGAGRQGLKAVQRFPEDFDGVVVGGVAADSTHFSLANIWAWQAATRSEASRLSPEKLRLLHEASVAACDGLDGARDGLIGDSERCQIDPGALQCKDVDRPTCLTAPQVEAVRQMYAPPTHSRTGRRLFGPLMPGSELGWGGFNGPNANAYAVEFFRSIVFHDPTWDPRTLNWDSDVERAEAVHPAVNAVNPDLSALVVRGGKLIMWGGWADTAINPAAETDYYRRVVARTGEDSVRSAIRLYMIPMMGHFLGGTGAHAYELDTQRLIEDWVERGVAPGPLTASHRANGTEDRTVLLCPYPEVAMYKGSGSLTEASSFECRSR